MTEREKMRQQRKMMLTATFLTGYQRSGLRDLPAPVAVMGRHSGLEEFCQKDVAGVLLSEGHVLPKPAASSLQPRVSLGGLALRELDGTNPSGGTQGKLLKSLVSISPFTMRLLLHWKYKPLQLMLGIR